MADFKVDPQNLRATADTLDGLHRELIDAKSTIGNWTGLGNSDIDDALEHFANKWNDSMHVLEKNMDGIVERLRGAADGYEQADQQIGSAASGTGTG